MRINKILANNNIVFKSIRTDKETVGLLKTGERPILENTKYTIYSALNNLCSNPERGSIEFLLDVAQNLQYGLKGDSEFRDIIDGDTLTPKERENTDWDSLLQDTIYKALNNSQEDVSDLYATADNLFSTKKEITEEEADILSLRELLNIKIVSVDTIEDSEKLILATNVRKNLDYFISSSEIPMQQKKYCLEKFSYLLSPNYEINPQLEDKRLNVLDEMLNDMIVKTPQEEILTTKGVDQLYTGMCAAISVARKALAYEDKSRYVDIVLEELNNKPTMKVYDITNLGSGKEIEIYKAEVDYNAGERKGYRILDSAAHIWMQNAESYGDGKINLITYTPFDDNNYEIYDDSFWYDGFENNISTEKELYRTLIKERSFLKSVYSSQKNMKNSYNAIKKAEKDSTDIMIKTKNVLTSIFADIFPNKTDLELKQSIESLFKFYTEQKDNNESNIVDKMPKELKEKILFDYIIQSNQEITQEQIQKLQDKKSDIDSLVNQYTKEDKSLKRLKSHNSLATQYKYNKNLYKAAAAHKIATILDVKTPENTIKYEKKLSIPPRDIQLVNNLKSIEKKLSNIDDTSMVALPNGTALPKKEVIKTLYEDIYKVKNTIPFETSKILEKITGQSGVKHLIDFYEVYINELTKGNSEAINELQSVMPQKTDKNQLLKELNTKKNILLTAPSLQEYQECCHYLGFSSAMEFEGSVLNNILHDMPEESFKEFAKKLCPYQKPEDEMSKLIEKFNNLSEEYNAMFDFWDIPSREDTIILKMEDKNLILSENKLDILQKKFAQIDRQRAINSKIESTKEKIKANNKAYKFSIEEEELFKNIEKSLNQMKRFCNTRFRALGRKLSSTLDEEYAQIGRLNGDFYVRAEGSSGLATQNIVRIFEMMTGKPYYKETYLDEAAEKVKSGKGSGILNMSVEDDAYGFHAQYIPSVTTESFTDPITGEITQEDVVWTDNSWGKSEKDRYWDGYDGFIYTDYSQGMGLKSGFIVAPDFRIGQKLNYLKHAQGHVNNDVFSVFSDVVLQADSDKTNNQLYKLISDITTMGDYQAYYDQLESQILQGKKLDIKSMEEIDIQSEIFLEKLLNRINKEINSKEDFDKLADTDPLKFTLKKLALYLSVNDYSVQEDIASISEIEELQEAEENVFEHAFDKLMISLGKSPDTLVYLAIPCKKAVEDSINEMEKKFNLLLSDDDVSNLINDIFFNEDAESKLDGSITTLENYAKDNIDKYSSKYIKNPEANEYFTEKLKSEIQTAIDKNLKITSLDCYSLSNNEYKSILFNIVDKYLNPKSDKELLTLLQGIQNATNEQTEGLFNHLTKDDLKIKIKDPYEFIVKLKDSDTEIMESLNEVISIEEFNQKFNQEVENEESNDIDELESTPETLYRTISNKLSYLNVQKFIKGFKDEALRKYKVRPAFPNPVPMEEEKLKQLSGIIFDFLNEEFSVINNYTNMEQICRLYETLNTDLENNSTFSAIIKNNKIQVTEDNKDEIEQILNIFKSAKESIVKCAESDIFISIVDSVISELNNKDIIYGKKINTQLAELTEIVNDISYLDTNPDEIRNIRNDEMKKELNSYIRHTINTNITKRYRNDAYKILKEYINLRLKGKTEEALKKQNQFESFLIKNFILKEPEEVLKQCVTLLQSGKKDTTEYNTLKIYLQHAIDNAVKTNIQYKLIKNQHNGNGNKIRGMLNKFNVKLIDGTECKLDKDAGLAYIVNQLKNLNDDHSTLKLFLAQSGLTTDAICAMMNIIDFDTHNKNIEKYAQDTLYSIYYGENIVSIVDKFISQCGIKTDSTKVLESLYEYYKRKTVNQDAEIYKDIEQHLETAIKNNKDNPVPDSGIKMLLEVLQSNIIEYIMQEYIQNNLNLIYNERNYLNNTMETIAALEPEEGIDADKTERFINKFKSTSEYIKNVLANITDEIEKTKIWSTQKSV